jgi:hypothetical protein
VRVLDSKNRPCAGFGITIETADKIARFATGKMRRFAVRTSLMRLREVDQCTKLADPCNVSASKANTVRNRTLFQSTESATKAGF